jgi:DNA replication protein DnaC
LEVELEPEVRLCPIHNVPTASSTFAGREFWSCPVCSAAEESARKQREIQREDALQREKLAQISKRLESLAIGVRFRSCSWDDYQAKTLPMQHVLSTAKEFADNFWSHSATGTNMMFLGSTGTGKNMIAALICMDVVQSGHTAVHTTAMKLVRRIKETMSFDSKITEQQAIDSFTAPSLLVIDEIGVQFCSPTEKLFLTEVINDRVEARRPTILISNLTVPEMEEVVGRRVVDRFYEGESKFLVFDWPSFRRGRSSV